ncbi:hypothetical protein AC249_AIPGENE22989 [Exaiptasia diaphana]|nr:hypothetical protein AC249_AIPGENE22989 [Exaiptasia diaphana]
MRRYRDGYASSMGSIMSCFKISDDGIWATTITRLSTISRRSTYSRASTRSSQSRHSSKPYFYKQVPQNAENPNQDISPEGEEILDQTLKNQEKDIGSKGVSSDGKREWSEIIRELKAEKETHEDQKTLSPDEIKTVEKGALHDPEILEQGELSLKKWKTSLQKLKSTKAEKHDSSKHLQHDILVTLHEQREDISEHQSTEVKNDTVPQKDDTTRSRGNSSSDDEEAKEEWTERISDKLSKQAKPEAKHTHDQLDKSNLPELLQELKTAKSEDEPELLKHGSTSKGGGEGQADLPEIVQDAASKDDGPPSEASMSSEPSEVKAERDQIAESLQDALQSDNED